MANLVKITDVQFVVGFTELGFEESNKLYQFLCKSNIPFNQQLVVTNVEQHLARASELAFGPNFIQYKMTSFPYVIWKEYYDDYERFLNIARSVDELRLSVLVQNKSYVVG